MLEATILVGLGAGAALGGCVIGYKFLTATPYVPAHKRTDEDKQKTKERIEKHFSVINIETEEDHILHDMDSEQERPFGIPVEDKVDKFEYEASVAASPTKKKFYVCDNPQCSFRARTEPAKDGKHYCKNHNPELKE